MNTRVDHLLDEALRLPVEERCALLVALLDSLEGSEDPSISGVWRADLSRRRQPLRDGTVQPVPWDDVEARRSAL